MADKTDKKPDEKAAAAPAAPARGGAKSDAAPTSRAGLLKSTPVLLTLVMILEAAVLFAGFKFLGLGPVAAQGADLVSEKDAADPHDADKGHGAKGAAGAVGKKTVELKIVEFKAPNKQSGRSYIYDICIYIAVKGELKEKMEADIADRDALLKDRIRTIIAQSDPEKLGGAEPGLETLRRQVKFQLEEILGEGVIEEVLVPRCIQFRTDY